MRASIFLSAIALFLSSAAAAEPVTVPFVGCPSDGQTDAIPAPKGKPVVVSLPPATAARLAYYKAETGVGTLAPRGWHCFGLYGSSGWVLVTAPQLLTSDDFFGKHPKPLTGPAVEVSFDDGGTSGRFGVAGLIARYFPDRRAFLQKVIAEKIEPASAFPLVPFKDDQFVSRAGGIVEIVNPPRRQGVGTLGRLVASDLPIHATVAVTGDERKDEELGGWVFAVRLPKDQDDLAPAILRWAEHAYLETK